MIWEKMSRKDARDRLHRMNNDKAYMQEQLVLMQNPRLDEPYRSIHDKLKYRYEQCIEKKENNEYTTRSKEYGVDLDMAEEIFRVLSEYEFSVRDAADEEIWIYLSMNVIPDIIIDRFGKPGSNLPHEDRFYANSRRVYPSMLWWYFYISYQSEESNPIQATKSILMNNQSDDISQLVERAGSGGYPVNIYKQIMREYANRLADGRKPDNLLSRALKLNIVQMETVEPELMFDGLETYVSDLFDKVE